MSIGNRRLQLRDNIIFVSSALNRKAGLKIDHDSANKIVSLKGVFAFAHASVFVYVLIILWSTLGHNMSPAGSQTVHGA